MSGVSTVREDTDGCVKKYRFSLDVYLITKLSYSYDIITDGAINSPGHGKNVFDGLDATDKFYLR